MDPILPLVERARAGDREAYGRIVERLHGQIAAYVAARLPRAGLVDEVVQETFVAGFTAIGDYRPAAGEFPAWLTGIARHRVLRAIAELERRRRHTPLSRLDALFAQEDGEAGAWHLERLRLCLERLSASARALLTARYRDGEAMEAIAARLDRAYPTVANRLCRLRAQLRRCVGG